jgi:RND family efflux transporter MFP subunit
MSMTVKIGLWRVCLSFGLAMLSLNSQAQPFPTPVVETTQVIMTELAPTMWAPGTVVSRNDAKIAAEIAGRITSIAEAGERFQAGDIIARIDDKSLRLILSEREAEIGQLEARLVYSDAQVDRLGQLAEQNSASRTQLDEITSERNVLSLQLASARAARDRVRYDLQRTQVAAPFTGQWVERHQHLGEYTLVGGVLGRLVDTNNKEVRVRAPVSVAPFVSANMLLSVKSEDRVTEHPVRAIIPVGDEISRSLEIRVILEDEARLVGSAVRVAVPTAFPASVLVVPRDVLVIRKEVTYVVRIVEDTAEQVPVKVGHADADLIAVSGKLSAGDRVVIRGAERLRNGQTVRVIGTRGGDSEPGY